MNQNDSNSFRNNQRTNHEIRAPRVFLIDHNSVNRGDVLTQEAKGIAQDLGLDLVEMQPGNRQKGIWPTCKIMDYGKMKYNQSKKQKSAKKPVLKEIMFHMKTAEHDLNIKINKIEKFLAKGHQVKFGITMKGREKRYKADALKKLNEQIEKLQQVSKFERIIEGERIIYTTLSPLG